MSLQEYEKDFAEHDKDVIIYEWFADKLNILATTILMIIGIIFIPFAVVSFVQAQPIILFILNAILMCAWVKFIYDTGGFD